MNVKELGATPPSRLYRHPFFKQTKPDKCNLCNKVYEDDIHNINK